MFTIFVQTDDSKQQTKEANYFWCCLSNNRWRLFIGQDFTKSVRKLQLYLYTYSPGDGEMKRNF